MGLFFLREDGRHRLPVQTDRGSQQSPQSFTTGAGPRLGDPRQNSNSREGTLQSWSAWRGQLAAGVATKLAQREPAEPRCTAADAGAWRSAPRFFAASTCDDVRPRGCIAMHAKRWMPSQHCLLLIIKCRFLRSGRFPVVAKPRARRLRLPAIGLDGLSVCDFFFSSSLNVTI